VSESFDLGVVGAGVMGSGIAQCAAQAGLAVLLIDHRGEALAAARAGLRRGQRLARMLGAQPSAAAPGSVEFSTDLHAIATVGFVVESVCERMEVKEGLFRQMDRLCPSEVCLASNTSAIPIATLAGFTQRPARVLGIHFMNPVALTTTVELVRGPASSDDTMSVARTLLQRLGKKHVEVRDGAGFVSNRVLMLAVNEAIAAAAEDKAAPADIDRVFTDCLGHKMGPLATADLVGLDVILDTLRVLAELAGPRYNPHPLLVAKVAAGQLGSKSGQGFFTHAKP
jgi:3-hydroxybutyryl-CoA dehydrogenase